MKAPDRDLRLLKHIVSYCEQIHMAVERFGADYSILRPILSIGTPSLYVFCRSANW